MTEEEWLSCSDPQALLAYLRGKVSDRKLRLFVVECGRRGIQWEENRDWTFYLQTLDAWGKGQIPNAKLELVREQLHAMGMHSFLSFSILDPEWDANSIASWAVSEARQGAWDQGITPEARKTLELIEVFPNFDTPQCIDAVQAELAAQCRTIHDIFGNPFRPARVDPSWLSSTVVALARGICDDRDFDQMPILADALQDADCTNAEILNHCREEKQVHVRGCWLVDLLTGRK